MKLRRYKTVLGLLKSPARWTKCCLARTKGGDKCAVDDPRAAKFCLLGALSRVYRSDDEKRVATFRLMEAVPGKWSVSMFNDDLTTKHKHILAVLKKAKI